MEIDLIIVGLLSLLRQELYSESTINCYKQICKKLKDFLIRVYGDTIFTLERGLAYLEESYNFSTLYKDGLLTHWQVFHLRIIQTMHDYAIHGTITKRYCNSKIILSGTYLETYEAFIRYMDDETNLSKLSKRNMASNAKAFIHFFSQKNICVSEIKLKDCDDYIQTLAGSSPRTIGYILSGIRQFLHYLDEKKILLNDYADKIHSPRISKQAKLPSVWKEEDIKKLLCTIDRNNPIGKRDYAMILIACTMGLRISDIKCLKITDFDWQNKQLSIIQHKTKKHLILPIPDATGWAVIDYIRNGRPQCTSIKTLFIKHNPPFDSFKDTDSFYETIRKYMRKAGIKKDHKCGFHSLRHTVASLLLNGGTDLPTITGVLGHSSTDVTSIYLKVQVEKLKECVLDYAFLLEGNYGSCIQ